MKSVEKVTLAHRNKDSIISRAASYRPDGLGFESHKGKVFPSPEPSRPALGHTQPPVGYWGSLPGVKGLGHEVDHSVEIE